MCQVFWLLWVRIKYNGYFAFELSIFLLWVCIKYGGNYLYVHRGHTLTHIRSNLFGMKAPSRGWNTSRVRHCLLYSSVLRSQFVWSGQNKNHVTTHYVYLEK
jgi:hypothetical protein